MAAKIESKKSGHSQFHRVGQKKVVGAVRRCRPLQAKKIDWKFFSRPRIMRLQ